MRRLWLCSHRSAVVRPIFQTRSLQGRELFTYDLILQQWHWAKSRVPISCSSYISVSHSGRYWAALSKAAYAKTLHYFVQSILKWFIFNPLCVLIDEWSNNAVLWKRWSFRRKKHPTLCACGCSAPTGQLCECDPGRSGWENALWSLIIILCKSMITNCRFFQFAQVLFKRTAYCNSLVVTSLSQKFLIKTDYIARGEWEPITTALLDRNFIRGTNGSQPRFRSFQLKLSAILDLFSVEKCLSKLNPSLKFMLKMLWVSKYSVCFQLNITVLYFQPNRWVQVWKCDIVPEACVRFSVQGAIIRISSLKVIQTSYSYSQRFPRSWSTT